MKSGPWSSGWRARRAGGDRQYKKFWKVGKESRGRTVHKRRGQASQQLRPYTPERSVSRPICEDNQVLAQSVLS
jgi:hypothetical protein